LDFPVMLGQSGIDGLELSVLSELVAFLGLHGSLSVDATAASTRAPEAAQFRITPRYGTRFEGFAEYSRRLMERPCAYLVKGSLASLSARARLLR
jgi:hypothetical protein